jgi:phage terminase large subunit
MNPQKINVVFPSWSKFLFKPKRYKVALGGRGSGKSYTVADALLITGYGRKIKVLCGREFQNSIADSVHSLLASRIDALGLRGQYEILRDTIVGKNGTEFIFKGLRHNIESIKSIYGITHLWIEEAATVSGDSWEILKPTIREPGSEIWITFNPGSSQDAISKRFITPYESTLMETKRFEDEHQCIAVVNYLDNPHFPDALEQERRWAFDNLPRALYDHIWLGKYNDSVDNAIIPAEWFDACIDAHVKLNWKLRGAKIYSHDPADTGKDPKGYAIRHGSVIIDAGEIEQPDINTSLDAACQQALDERVDLFTWDCDGMGVGLKREVDTWLSGKGIQIRQFRGSASPDRPDSIYEPVDNQQQQKRNKDVFKNKRAQNYWLLRDRCYKTYRAVIHGEYSDPDNLISFSSSIKLLQKLRSEICRIPKKYNTSGLIQIMSKEDMRKVGIASPNIADSVMMAMDAPEAAVEFNDIEFKSLW